MRTRANCYLGIIALTVGVISSSQAQEPAAVMVDIGACIDLPSRAARNACYESVADEARASRPPAVAESPATVAEAPSAVTESPATVTESPVTVAESPATAAVAPPAAVQPGNTATAPEAADSAVASFGTSTPAQAASVVDGAEGQAELHDRITGLQEREPGRWLITLASGQVWYQTNSGRIRLRKDMDVRIFPSPLGGSFRLAGIENSTGFIQVTRVK